MANRGRATFSKSANAAILKWRKSLRSTLPRLTELEGQTAALWLRVGTIVETSRGEENTYYVDQFENQFFCKNYPR